jgi:hypothetical protein
MAATVAVTPQHSSSTVPSDLRIRDVPDWTDKLRRTNVVFSKLIGSEGPPSTPMNKAEWGWGSPDPYETTITEALTTTDGTSVTFADGTYLQVGDIVYIGAEEMQVTAVAGNVATVTRGFAGTTAATALDNATAFIIGPALTESADDADSPYTQGEVDFNYHQIMTFTWPMSKRAEVTPTYEHRGGNRFNAELRKKMEHTAPVRFELRLLLGQRAAGSGSTPSALGGLRQSSYITTRTSISGILTETAFMSQLQTISSLVGDGLMPDTIMGGDLVGRIMSSWYNETRRSTMDSTKANVRWTEFETPFGLIKFVPNYFMNTVASNKAYVFDPSVFKKRPYAQGTGWQTGEHSTQGWHRRGFLRGDFTLLAEQCDARGELYGFSTTVGDYSGIA